MGLERPFDELRELGNELSKDGSIHVTDERINTITHLAAACLALLGSVLLIAQAATQATVWHIVGFSVYGLSLLSLFVFSTLHHGYHGKPHTNELLRTFDYVSIFLVIGGTLTPLVLVLYRTIIGWSVLGVVWVIAVVGITLRSSRKQLPKYITNTLFIVSGWLPAVLITAGARLSIGALLLVGIGGLLYSFGFIIYVVEKPNPKPGVFGFHEIWHCLVVVAAFLQYLFMYLYVLPK